MSPTQRLLILTIWTLASTAAHADEFETARDQNVVETKHTADISVKQGVATYVVRRSFQNRGTVADEVRLQIALPYGAAATGLRIKGKDRWYKGELMHARKAEELYRELTGLGPSKPKDPALLYWQWTSELGLRVFPVFPKSTSTVEYTLTVPTDYTDGNYYVSYGRKPKSKKMATPLLRFRGKNIKTIELDQKRVGRRASLTPKRKHKLLGKLGRNANALVKTLAINDSSETHSVKLTVDVHHTWPGDLQLDLVAPSGKLYPVTKHDFSISDNNLRKTYKIPHNGSIRGSWHLIVEDHHPLDGGSVRAWSLQASHSGAKLHKDTGLSFIPQPSQSGDDTATAALSLGPTSKTKIRLGKVDIVQDKQFARLEIDMASRLSKTPKGQHVVFVVDASRTVTQEGIDAQLRLAKKYLEHIPGAKFQLVGFRRFAKAWTSSFVPRKNFSFVVSKLRAQGQLTPGNGSFLDRGLAQAGTMLEGIKKPRAIVLFTDGRLRRQWETASIVQQHAKILGDATVHVVDIANYDDSEVVVDRDDNHQLFPMAKPSGGVAVHFRGSGAGRNSRLREEVLYLVRPTRLDSVTISNLPKSILADQNVPDTLQEGQGLRWQDRVDNAPDTIVLRGQLWSKPVVYQAQAQEPMNIATAGFVFSHDQHGDLSEQEQFMVAVYGKAVSPVTSYLAIEPGVRPSTIGFGRGNIGSGSGAGYGLGKAMLLSGQISFDWRAIAAKIRAQCPSKDKVTLQVETHDKEIANVTSKDTAAQCAIEQMWKVMLKDAPGNIVHRVVI